MRGQVLNVELFCSHNFFSLIIQNSKPDPAYPISCEGFNQVVPDRHDLKSQWIYIIFHENASNKLKHFLMNYFEQILMLVSCFGTNVPLYVKSLCF